jgi:IS30 family transposase
MRPGYARGSVMRHPADVDISAITDGLDDMPRRHYGWETPAGASARKTA